MFGRDVRESLVRAIVKGTGGVETRRVTLEIDLDREGLEFRVRDEGPGFDPTRLPAVSRVSETMARTAVVANSRRGRPGAQR